MNTSGRGFPDIAAKADPHVIYAGVFYPVVGTSLASPTVASIFALVNDRLVSAGRPPLGFINLWLYKEGYKAFTDITTGESTIMCTENVTNTIEATEGWDPVSIRCAKLKMDCIAGKLTGYDAVRSPVSEHLVSTNWSTCCTCSALPECLLWLIANR